MVDKDEFQRIINSTQDNLNNSKKELSQKSHKIHTPSNELNNTDSSSYFNFVPTENIKVGHIPCTNKNYIKTPTMNQNYNNFNKTDRQQNNYNNTNVNTKKSSASNHGVR